MAMSLWIYEFTEKLGSFYDKLGGQIVVCANVLI